MGNAIVSPCFQPSRRRTSSVKLVFPEGTTRVLTGRHVVAGAVMFEFPDRVVCHADSFFIGQPIPSLGIHDLLMPGETYFVLPIERLACNVLSASTLGSLGSSPSSSRSPLRSGQCPFEHLKGSDGRVLIKVMPEFITALITGGRGIAEESAGSPSTMNSLCSTPELQKHYQQLVGSKEQVWSPKLETVSEYKIRFSPCRFVGLEWKKKE